MGMHARFRDREDAGRQLADELAQYRGLSPLVLAIPRGGLPIADRIAESLQGDLDVVLAHKLGHPSNPELAIGAIDETGWTWLYAPGHPGMPSDAELEEMKADQLAALQRRRKEYDPWCERRDPAGRIAIIVDDGLATGATMIAALHAVRAARPLELVCAVPVGASDSLQRISGLADDIVCLYEPAFFSSVGEHYDAFPQVSDEEAVAILRRATLRSAARGRGPDGSTLEADDG